MARQQQATLPYIPWLFAWDSAQNGLVAHPIASGISSGQPNLVGWHGKTLRAMGWKIDFNDMRKSLPRPVLQQIVAGNDANVAEAAAATRSLDAMRARR